LEKKIRTLESELKEKNIAIEAANTALELNQRAKSDADHIVDKVTQKCDMRIAAMDAECEARLQKLRVDHEKETREMLQKAEATGRAKLESYEIMKEKCKSLLLESKVVRKVQTCLEAEVAQFSIYKQETTQTVTKVMSVFSIQQEQLMQEKAKVSSMEESIKSWESKHASIDESRSRLAEQLRGERDLVDQWKQHEGRKSEEATKWESMEKKSRGELEAKMLDLDQSVKELEASRERLKENDMLYKESRVEVSSLKGMVGDLQGKLDNEEKEKQILAEKLQNAERGQKSVKSAAEEKNKQNASELSKRMGEIVKLKKECQLMSKHVEEGKRQIVTQQEERQKQESELIKGLEKANAAIEAAKKEGRETCESLNETSTKKDKKINVLQEQINCLKADAKESAGAHQRQIAATKVALGQTSDKLKTSEAKCALLNTRHSEEGGKQKELEEKCQALDENLNEKLDEVKALKNDKIALEQEKQDLASHNDAQEEEINSLRIAKEKWSESEAFSSQLEGMENLMLKLSDNIRHKEIQVKQLQDTVQFGCEERRELLEQINTLKAQEGADITNTGSRTPRTNNGKQKNNLQLPEIPREIPRSRNNSKRGVRN